MENPEGIEAQTPSRRGESETEEGEGGEVVVESRTKDADIICFTRKGPDALLNIHDQLNLARLQQVL